VKEKGKRNPARRDGGKAAYFPFLPGAKTAEEKGELGQDGCKPYAVKSTGGERVDVALYKILTLGKQMS